MALPNYKSIAAAALKSYTFTHSFACRKDLILRLPTFDYHSVDHNAQVIRFCQMQMAETQAVDLARLHKCKMAKSTGRQYQDVACLGAAALGFAMALISRKNAKQTKQAHTALQQEIRALRACHERLEDECNRTTAQRSEAEARIIDYNLVSSRAEAKLQAIRGQLEEKTQEYEAVIRSLTAERDNAVAEYQVEL